jgi:PAS domain S-box-containing protein
MSSPSSRLSGDEARARLYDVMRSEGSATERIRRALTVGTEYFGVEHGYVTEIDRDTDDWEIYISLDPDGAVAPEGLNVDYSTTYCRRTIEEETVVALHDAPDEDYERDSEFQSYGFHCYHGAPVMVEGEPFGTVCFVSQEARAEAFSDSEKAFTDLIAQMISTEIERERKQAALDAREAEIEKRQELYRAVIDASFDLVFRLDREGIYTYHSPASEEILGYTPEEIVGQSYTLLLPDGEGSELADGLFERVLDGETVEERYLPLETKQGDILYVDIRVTPIYAANVPVDERTPADIVALQGMAHDATERKQYDRLIRVLNRVLRHNLRNDITIIQGYAGVLEDRVGPEEAQLAERIQDTSERLLGMSETARELEENFQTDPDLEDTDVVALVERLAEQAGDRYEAAEVRVDTPQRALARSAPRLETALWELLDNAASHAGEEPSIEVSVRDTGSDIEIAVADDGPGLPSQEAAVLESGEETPLVHGSGLGLWLVYWVVSSLDGEVRVPEAPGGHVAVRLPAEG